MTWTIATATPWLVNPPTAADHKYTRGVLGVRTGSPAYPGAAVLGVEAAWRTGIGMVRYVPFEEVPEARSAILHRRPETVFVAGRTDAWLVGSGMDTIAPGSATEAAIDEFLQGTTPLVIDAGAIPTVARFVSAYGPVTAPTVLTPHAGEFGSLARAVTRSSGSVTGAPSGDDIAQVAATLGVTIMLKGSVTRVVTPTGRSGTYGPATPWLATAGTGDVLAGILGALTARHLRAITKQPDTLLEVSLSAALLHDTAARLASRTTSSADLGVPITALDVAEALPEATLEY